MKRLAQKLPFSIDAYRDVAGSKVFRNSSRTNLSKPLFLVPGTPWRYHRAASPSGLSALWVPSIDVFLRLLALFCRSLLTQWQNICWQIGRPRQAVTEKYVEGGKSKKLKLPLLYNIHATYGRIQMTKMPKSLKKTSMALRTRLVSLLAEIGIHGVAVSVPAWARRPPRRAPPPPATSCCRRTTATGRTTRATAASVR